MLLSLRLRRRAGPGRRTLLRAEARAAPNAQAQASEAAAGAQPVIIRNAGGGGPRDVHLENFSVSNGGQELIEVRPRAASGWPWCSGVVANSWGWHVLYNLLSN